MRTSQQRIKDIVILRLLTIHTIDPADMDDIRSESFRSVTLLDIGEEAILGLVVIG